MLILEFTQIPPLSLLEIHSSDIGVFSFHVLKLLPRNTSHKEICVSLPNLQIYSIVSLQIVSNTTYKEIILLIHPS